MDKSKKELKATWDEYYPKVYGYFYKRLDDKYVVEELVIQTMTTSLMAKNVKSFRAYIWKVSHNYLVRYIQTKNTNPMIISWDEASDLGVESIPVFEIDRVKENLISDNYKLKKASLRECIENNLKTETEKEIVTLSIHQEKNSSEISRILNIKPGTVRQKLARTLSKLRSNCIDLWSALKTGKKYTNLTEQ